MVWREPRRVTLALVRLMLRVDDVHLSFGGVKALAGVSVHAVTGKITSVIGPNGAGKTSLFNVISGFYRPQSGKVVLDGEDISRLKPHTRAYRGMSRTFQNIALFHGMTVLDNVKLGAHTNLKSGVFSAALRLPQTRREEAELDTFVRSDILPVLDLVQIQNNRVEDLPYGLQKRVELARALVMRPKILLLDEPVAGMNREEKREMSQFVAHVNKEFGTTVLLIEHDMSMVMSISDHVSVISFGKPVASGTAEEVRTNPKVIEAYLGGAEESSLPSVA